MCVTEQLTVAIDFNSTEKNTMEVNGYQKLFANILQNIFFCAQQKIEIHTGLKQHEGEQMMTNFHFG